MIGRRRAVLGAAFLVGGAAITPLLWTGEGAATDEPDNTANAEASADAETVAISRSDLVEKAEANGTVGYGDQITLPIEASGIVTQTPSSGDVLWPGDELLRVADKPIILAQGEQPLYRELRRVATSERDAANDKIGLQTGPDVQQLQIFLLDAGFDDKGRLEADGEFGVSTERAVKDWQRSVGHPATGKVNRSQLVFIDGAIRIDKAPTVGASFESITVTANSPTVSVTVTTKQRTFFEVGSSVELESAGATATGTVINQKRVVSDDGTTRYAVEITLDAGEDLGGAEAVAITATRTVASDVLTVPVRALVALAEGGWAVQVDGPKGITLTGVELGDVVNGLAEITGLDEGTDVVVPT